MAGDLNIRDSSWNPSFFFHSIHNDLLMDIADSLDLSLLKSTNQVPTRYLDNVQNTNSVINLMFLRLDSLEFDNYTIHSEFYYLFDHTLLTVNVSIIKKFVPNKWYTIIKNSEEEDKFITNLIETIRKIDTEQINNKELFELAIQEFVNKSDVIWYKYLKCINITKHSKTWWNEKCQSKLVKYRTFKQIENWKAFKSTVKKTKQIFFDDKIQEIA